MAMVKLNLRKYGLEHLRRQHPSTWTDDDMERLIAAIIEQDGAEQTRIIRPLLSGVRR